MKSTIKQLLVTAAIATLTFNIPAQNLIVNGSFEFPVLPLGPAAYPTASQMAPWQTHGSFFEFWASPLPSEAAADGRQHLEILGGGTSVWQTVATVVGEDYQLSFYHSPRPTVQSTLTLSIGGQAIATFDEDGAVLQGFRWRWFRTNFTATATSTIIAFSDAAPTAAGTHIDNVVLERLPLYPNIRVSEVELCWESVVNKMYQVQFRSPLTTNAWIDWGTPMLGTGTTNCMRDTVPVSEPQRFYRVITLP